MDTPSSDDDLTNLNWVAGIPVPIDYSVSPPKTHSSDKDYSLAKPKKDNKLVSSSRCRLQSGRNLHSVLVDEHGNKKPNCSYTCLITMALRVAANSSIGGSLPVHEIYRCIQTLFPFFKYAPDGWKNSVRHTLSLGTIFKKVLRNEEWQGKKGYYWEMAPDQDEAMDKEVNCFLIQEGQSWEMLKETPLLATTSHGPLNSETDDLSNKQLFTPPRKYKTKKSLHTTTPSKEEQREEELPPEITIYSPQMQAQLKKTRTPVTPITVPTREVFDTSNTPSQFVGIQTPQSDDIGAARELFGNGSSVEFRADSDTTPPNSEVAPFSNIPAYNMYGFPTFMMGCTDSSSPILGISPSAADGTSPSVSPQGVSYMPVTMFPPMFLPPYCWGSHSVPPGVPMCSVHQQGSRSTLMGQCESQDSFHHKKRSSTGGGKKRKKQVKNNSTKKIKSYGCSRRLKFEELKNSNSTLHDIATSPFPCINGRLEDSFEQHEPTVDDKEKHHGTEKEIWANRSSLNTSFNDHLKPQGFGYNTSLIGVHGLSKDKIRELEKMVGTTTELDSLFSSSGQNSLQITPDASSQHQSPPNRDLELSDKLKPPKMISETLEVTAMDSLGSSHTMNVTRNESLTPNGIPALNSLLNLVDASIVGLEQVLNAETAN